MGLASRALQCRAADAASAVDVPTLGSERLAVQPVGHPLGYQRARRRAEHDRRPTAHGVTRLRIDDEALGHVEGPNEALGVLQRAQLVRLAGQAEVGAANLLREALPGERLAKLVEGVLVLV